MGSSFSNIVPLDILVCAASTRCLTRLVGRSNMTRGVLCHGDTRTLAQKKVNAMAGWVAHDIARVSVMLEMFGRVSQVRELMLFTIRTSPVHRASVSVDFAMYTRPRHLRRRKGTGR